jgi:hypothetical protein
MVVLVVTKAWSNTFDDNGKLVINYDANTIGTNVLVEENSL